MPFSTYRVIKPIENVLMGKVAPWFGQIGGGIQYYFGKTGYNIQELIDMGYLESIDEVIDIGYTLMW